MHKQYDRHITFICRLKSSGIGRWVISADLIALAFAAALLPAAPVMAQSPVPGTFNPPPGCTGWLTVQSRGCRVSNHYKCEADPVGDQWRADFDQEGIFFVSHIDSETQWIESFDMFPTVRQWLEPNPADPASFSNLLSDGMDSFSFGLDNDNGERTSVHGYDQLTGNTTTIDGVTLQETEFDFTESSPDGTVVRKARGHEWIHPEWRLFFSGKSTWESPEGPLPIDGTPMQFIMPGEKGFFSTEPIFDCDAITSSLPAQRQSVPLIPVGAKP